MNNVSLTKPEKRKWLLIVAATCSVILLILGLLFPSLAVYKSYSDGINSTYVGVYAASVEGDNTDEVILNCAEGTQTSYDFTVKNTLNGKVSEVSQKYDVIVEFSSPLDDFVNVAIGDANVDISNDGKTYKFTNEDWKFEAGKEGSHDLSLVFSVRDITEVTSNISIPDVSIRVNTTQID